LQTGQYGVFTVSTEQNTQTPENDGNVDGITAEP
jgi:hypothetical protein